MTVRIFLPGLLVLAVLFGAVPTSTARAGGYDQPIVLGNPNGDVTLIEFLDYQCPGCKAIHPSLEAFVREDGNIRLEIKLVAILGPLSEVAAKAALAARNQGRLEPMHKTLMRIHRPLSEGWVWDVAAMVDLDQARLKEDMADPDLDDVLWANLKIGLGHKMRGTPSFMVGDTFLSGGTIPQIKALIAKVRSGRS